MEFQTTIQNYNPKSSTGPEIFPIFQHKVEQIPYLTQLTEIVHIDILILCRFVPEVTKVDGAEYPNRTQYQMVSDIKALE